MPPLNPFVLLVLFSLAVLFLYVFISFCHQKQFTLAAIPLVALLIMGLGAFQYFNEWNNNAPESSRMIRDLVRDCPSLRDEIVTMKTPLRVQESAALRKRCDSIYLDESEVIARQKLAVEEAKQ